MIEEVQDQIVSDFQTYLPAELTSLAAPDDGVSLTLTSPKKYLINFDPKSTVIPADCYPACVMIPGPTQNDARLQQGHVLKMWHTVLIAFLFSISAAGLPTDALDAIEKLQRTRSRYAKAATAVLVKRQGQGSSCIEQTDITRIEPTPTALNAQKTLYLGSVGIMAKFREKVTL